MENIILAANMGEHNEKQYWEQRYETRETQWDIGFASPAITTYIDGILNKDTRILIPGCGNAYEAGYLLEQGFTDITLIDIAAQPIQNLRERFGDFKKNLNIIEGDFFGLGETYDLIIEQTFFCALLPQQRNAYAAKMKTLLKPAGRLVGVLFSKMFEVSPPYGGAQEEYIQLFQQYFGTVEIAECYNSISARAGAELFISIS